MPSNYRRGLIGQAGTYSTTGPVVTLGGSALTAHRTFATAVSASDIADGETLTVLIETAAGARAVWRATFASGAGTLTRVTELVAIGTISDAATVSVSVADDVRTLADAGEHAYHLGSSLSGTVNLSVANGHTQYGTATGGVTITFSNPASHAATAMTLALTKGATSVTWPASSFAWLGAAPDIGAAGTYLVHLRIINGTWYATYGGKSV